MCEPVSIFDNKLNIKNSAFEINWTFRPKIDSIRHLSTIEIQSQVYQNNSQVRNVDAKIVVGSVPVRKLKRIGYF